MVARWLRPRSSIGKLLVSNPGLVYIPSFSFPLFCLTPFIFLPPPLFPTLLLFFSFHSSNFLISPPFFLFFFLLSILLFPTLFFFLLPSFLSSFLIFPSHLSLLFFFHSFLYLFSSSLPPYFCSILTSFFYMLV